MNFDWSEYLNLAQELAGPPTSLSNEEARLRSAISRAYYAAFCKARNHLRDNENLSIRPPRGESTHQFVIRQFKFSSDASRRQIGTHLNRLRVDRNKADYDDTVSRVQKMTQFVLTMAQSVISSLQTL